MSDYKAIQKTRMIFARKLKEFRVQKGFSQEELADIAELHRTYVGSVERGERNISIDNMERLADALGVQLMDLLNDG
jgi:transcriptional regulator with XRE-family HTH domain